MSGIQDSCWSRDERAFLTGMSAADPGSIHTRTDAEVRAILDENRHRWDMSRLYHEAHITIEPATDRTFDEFRLAWSDDQWRVSAFSEDDVDGIEGKWFITSRAQSYQQMRDMVASQVILLMEGGLTVLRYKIEDTLLDSQHGDSLVSPDPTGALGQEAEYVRQVTTPN